MLQNVDFTQLVVAIWRYRYNQHLVDGVIGAGYNGNSKTDITKKDD